VSTAVEVFDVAESSMKCRAMPNYPLPVFGAYGGAQLDGIPIICDGHSNVVNNTDCLKFGKGQWTNVTFDDKEVGKLPAYTDYPRKQYRNKLLVMGNFHFSLRHDNFYLEKNIPAADVIDGACATFLNHDTLIIIGVGANRTKAYYQTMPADVNDFKLISAEMKHPRFRAGCGKIRVNQHNLKHAMIVAGGDGQITTELLTDVNGTWKPGPGIARILHNRHGSGPINAIFNIIYSSVFWWLRPEQVWKGCRQLRDRLKESEWFHPQGYPLFGGRLQKFLEKNISLLLGC
jgi:hypothetical protein